MSTRVTGWLTVAAALAISAIPLAAAGAPILKAFALMAQGAAGSQFAITETLTRATPPNNAAAGTAGLRTTLPRAESLSPLSAAGAPC